MAGLLVYECRGGDTWRLIKLQSNRENNGFVCSGLDGKGAVIVIRGN